MKILNKIFIIFCLIATLTGCSNSTSPDSIESYKDIQEALMNMQSYISNVEITYISNKGQNNYSVLQSIRKDGKYIFETTAPQDLVGSIIIYDGSLIWQYNPHNQEKEKISVADKEKLERQQINIFTFLENHLTSKDITVETSSIDENVYTILEAVIPSDNTYFSTEKLWLNNKTNMPEKLIIYDKEEQERVIVEFKDFIYNPQLDDNLFSIENLNQNNN
ncbi:MAG: outer-membrane lipoprotein carrier protein LolA [bacterium]